MLLRPRSKAVLVPTIVRLRARLVYSVCGEKRRSSCGMHRSQTGVRASQAGFRGLTPKLGVGGGLSWPARARLAAHEAGCCRCPAWKGRWLRDLRGAPEGSIGLRRSRITSREQANPVSPQGPTRERARYAQTSDPRAQHSVRANNRTPRVCTATVVTHSARDPRSDLARRSALARPTAPRVWRSSSVPNNGPEPTRTTLEHVTRTAFTHTGGVVDPSSRAQDMRGCHAAAPSGRRRRGRPRGRSAGAKGAGLRAVLGARLALTRRTRW